MCRPVFQQGLLSVLSQCIKKSVKCVHDFLPSLYFHDMNNFRDNFIDHTKLIFILSHFRMRRNKLQYATNTDPNVWMKLLCIRIMFYFLSSKDCENTDDLKVRSCQSVTDIFSVLWLPKLNMMCKCKWLIALLYQMLRGLCGSWFKRYTILQH